ncbi:hypothetical protein B0H14DRAFT_2616844 [Mycena olivaceomarginata]|nr:hypothetical protein B0H14DRAFT_2616844 [Mycena olivaceomarginata]
MDNYIPRLYPNLRATQALQARRSPASIPRETREKARQRMQLVRSRAPRTAEAKAEAAEKRYARDADLSMRKRKFIAKFGADAFFNYYVPQHKLRLLVNMPSNSTGTWGARTVVKEEAERVLMMSSPEWDQSRAQSQPLSDPNLVLCLIQMACPMPFFPNSTNYVGTGEHDKNPRKYWYLVLNQGVFTKKYGGSGFCQGLYFFTRNDARNKWAKNCIRRHAHDGDAVLDAEGDGASASSEDDSAPSVRSISPTPGRQTPARAPARQTPAGTAARRTPLRTAPKATPPPKRESSRVSVPPGRAPSRTPVKKEFVLPLYRDDTPPLEMEVDPAPIVERPPLPHPSVSSGPPSRRRPRKARPRPPRVRRLQHCASPAAPLPTPANGASAPLPRAAARACTPGGSASAAPRSQAQPAGSRLPFLYNETRRKLYKDAKKAMEEMADTDTVQVVDYQDACGIWAGRSSGSD